MEAGVAAQDVDMMECCYLMVSTKAGTTFYIGDTSHLAHLEKIVTRHNRGMGGPQTSSPDLRPWSLVAYVTGFGRDKQLHKWFARQVAPGSMASV